MSKSKNRSAAQFFGVPLICVSTMVALFASIAPQALAGDQLPPVIERAMQRFDFDPDGLSVMVQNVETGDVLLDYQAHVPRNPASTMKLLTTYASLDTLTPGHLWNTKVYTFGDIDANGVLHGDLAIRGGGDPFFVEETLWKMLMELRRRGLRSITGDLLLDNSLFDLDREDPAAFDGEPLRAYNVAPDALLFNLKVVRFWFEPDADSRSVKVSSLPRLPNLEIVNDLKLVPGRCRGYMRGIEIDAEPNGNRVRFHGRFPDGCRRYSFGRTLLDHDSYAYGLFRSLWESLGGTLEGGYRRVVVDDSQKPLMSWQSRSYGELIRLINKHSNNVMTRQVFLTLGSHYFGEPASLTKARDAVRVWLDEQRIDFDSLVIDNGERLAPAAFNDDDNLEIIRRITRDAGSDYKVGAKDVRARDVQMLFADASTGAHSPALVRQGQISELINARPKARRRILEEAAGISGLYQRRHEAELKLRGAETNLSRVDDVIEQLAAQLAQLARQAKQAARYRELSEALRHAEGLLLYRRWREANDAAVAAETVLTERVTAASEAERTARAAVAERARQEETLPPLREEEAIAAAVLQRLTVQRDTLADEEARAEAAIETLQGRIEQLARDTEREDALNHDAGETIARLEEEGETLTAEAEGHEARLEEAATEARDAASVLQDRESAHAQLTEDVARLAARHQSAQRLRDDAQRTLERSESEATSATAAAKEAQAAEGAAETALTAADALLADTTAAATAAEAALVDADETRATAQTREAQARAGRSEAEGEVSALQAEVAALARLVERDTAEGGQVLDLLKVKTGYEKALGAALADDLRAPAVQGEAKTGWTLLPAYDTPQPLPDGIRALADHVSIPDVLARRLTQVGLVDRADGPRLQSALKPGQRIVSREGDLWRWDGFRAGAEDAPSAAALRLQQLNRLQELKQDLVEARARADGAARAHEHLKSELQTATEADAAAREERRAADQAVTEASRALSRAEADRNIAAGKLESLRMAASRHEEMALDARTRLKEAEAALAELGDLDAARAEAEEVRVTVEAARMLMMTRRSAHDALRRTGAARVARATGDRIPSACHGKHAARSSSAAKSRAS